MLNIEFWKDRLKDLHADHHTIAVLNGVPELCTYVNCKECDFSKNGCSGLFDWLREEHKEPEVDWENDIDWLRVPVNTEVLVRGEFGDVHRRRFVVFVPKSKAPYRTFNGGEEHGNSSSVIPWTFCKLVNEEDIEKYRKKAHGKVD